MGELDLTRIGTSLRGVAKQEQVWALYCVFSAVEVFTGVGTEHRLALQLPLQDFTLP